MTWDEPRRGRRQERLLLGDGQIRVLQRHFRAGLPGEGGGGRCAGLGPGVEEDWGLLVVAVGGGQRVCGDPFSLRAAPASAAPGHRQGFGHLGLPLDAQLLDGVASLDVVDIFEEIQVELVTVGRFNIVGVLLRFTAGALLRFL